MPLKLYRCPLCNAERETLKTVVPTCNHDQKEPGHPIPLTDMQQVLTAPNQKFMVQSDPWLGKSKLKDQKKILKARSRNHSRDVGLDETIQLNKMNGLDAQVARSFLNHKGEKRRKIDDI